MTTGRARAETSREQRVAYLLRKTRENGATADEEIAAVQLAHMLVRQHGLDLEAFKAALAKIGNPPRYSITEDGFLVPAEPATEETCPASPTRRHRMEKYMRGTLATGLLYCVHCGFRRGSADAG